MDVFLERVNTLKKGKSTNAFARFIGVNQKTLDQMLKGERKPSLQMLVAICTKCEVSADWLLGFDTSRGHAVTAHQSSVAIGGNVTNGILSNGNCANCELMKAAAKIMGRTSRK